MLPLCHGPQPCCLASPQLQPCCKQQVGCARKGLQDQVTCTDAMGMANTEAFPKMYARPAVCWTISRVAQRRNSSDIIWFCLHFIKKQFTFSKESCLKDLLFSLVSSSINGSFLLFLNLTPSAPSLYKRLGLLRLCEAALSHLHLKHGRRRQQQASFQPLSQVPSATFGILSLFVAFSPVLPSQHASYVWALWHWLYHGWRSLAYLMHAVRSNTDFKDCKAWQIAG